MIILRRFVVENRVSQVHYKSANALFYAARMLVENRAIAIFLYGTQNLVDKTISAPP